MNTKIQKLIINIESLKLHYTGEKTLLKDEVIDLLISSGQILQKLSDDALNIKVDIDRANALTESFREVNKMLLESLKSQPELTANDHLNLHFFSKIARKKEDESVLLRRENAQLKAELELIKEKQQKEF